MVTNNERTFEQTFKIATILEQYAETEIFRKLDHGKILTQRHSQVKVS